MMKDRLIELILNAPKIEFPFGSRLQGKTYQTAQNLADHILADGWIRLPCKVGDTVYVLTSDSPTGIEETRVSQIKIRIKENGKIQYKISAPCIYDDWGEAHWTFCNFGKTVFLTKKEAEKALAERKNNV